MRKTEMSLIVLLFCIAWLIMLTSACTIQPDNKKENTSQMASSSDVFKIQGTIMHKNLEGGFFVIVSDDNQIYDPINLPEAFQKDGLKVNATARYKSDTMSFHMVGDIIEIIDITPQQGD
ncbi:hypothetical protein SAMN02745220_03863 [Desulfopila aestuarii DSM 18488]|uniref:Uncharacterized protein n=2 Tax=Desulfopila aestuarii TaxID=231440 RepID=A0A1M7YER3_9BACT|nr:hypothetical protein SAMN02745220_03863 [Desulfopila aestuarii DSM 18488]